MTDIYSFVTDTWYLCLFVYIYVSVTHPQRLGLEIPNFVLRRRARITAEKKEGMACHSDLDSVSQPSLREMIYSWSNRLSCLTVICTPTWSSYHKSFLPSDSCEVTVTGLDVDEDAPYSFIKVSYSSSLVPRLVN